MWQTIFNFEKSDEYKEVVDGRKHFFPREKVIKHQVL